MVDELGVMKFDSPEVRDRRCRPSGEHKHLTLARRDEPRKIF
jgi:hypothetical protein